MKKGLTTLLVILLAVGAMLVSCKAEVATPADELVAVSFELDSSRALSATLEEFDEANYFWYYAAKKTDSTGLISGQTAGYDFDPEDTDTRVLNADAVSSGADARGLKGYTVPNFSQGTWAFTLYAYATRPTTDVEKAAWVYSGEATGVILKKGGQNKAEVIVSPNPQGNGILFVDIDHIKLDENSESSHNNVAPVISIEVVQGGTPVIQPGTNVKYSAPAGMYKVIVDYTDGYISYAKDSVIATVYSGLTTTVTGTVDELVTYAQFDAEQNPDIITRTASSTTPVTPSTTSDVVLSDTDTETPRVTATVPAEAATNLLPEDPSASMSLALNVDTKDSSSTSVTYDISMTKTVTLNSEVTTSKVSSVTDFVTVQIKLSANLANVKVTHSGNAMVKCDSLEELNASTAAAGAFYYDPAGTLYIKTKSFSPFAVSFTSAFVASMDGVKYTSLAAAVNAVADNNLHTITLLSDYSGAGIGLFNAEGDTARNIVIDLGGHTFTCTEPVGSTGTVNQALHLEKGNTVTIKNGTITTPATTTATFRFIIQNYSNLTLEDVTLDGRNLNSEKTMYTLSNNCGNVLITGKTSIIAKSSDNYALDAYYWPSAGYTEGVSITVDTTGTISGKIALDSDATATSTYKSTILFKAGTFMNGSISIEKGTFSAEGGTFYGYDPSGVVAEGYVAVLINENAWKVVPAVAKIGNTYYASLQAAYGAVQDEETIVFLKDITSALVVDNGETFTIDLGGNEWSGVLDLYHGFVSVQNGTMTKTIYVNPTGETTSDAGTYNKLTIGNNLTIGSDYSVILWDGESGKAYGSLVDINGTLNGWIWVMGNNTEGNCVINLNDGAHTANIALNGYAILNVNEGATVIGPEDEDASAIEVRAGVLNVNGGTITCLYQPTAAEQNNNGTSTWGAGVGISQYNNSSIEAHFNSGMVKGHSGLYWTNTLTEDQTQKTTVVIPLLLRETMFEGIDADHDIFITVKYNDEDTTGLNKYLESFEATGEPGQGFVPGPAIPF